MKIVQVGSISTGLVIILGIAMVVPAFMQSNHPLLVLLSFNITDEANIPQWCNDLSSILNKHNVKATLFVTGKIADDHPECVSVFSNKIDIGSQTYDYVSLTSINNYSEQLREIKNGKAAIDNAGKLDSRLFKAPHGDTDDNIYSLLSSSGILADFSYDNQYNKYYQNQFIKFDSIAYDGTYHSPDFFKSLPITNPAIINFDNTTPVEKIDDFITHLKSSNIRFVSASELTGIDLTVHEDKWP